MNCLFISYADERMYIIIIKKSLMGSLCTDHCATYFFIFYFTLKNFPYLCKDQHWSLQWLYNISLCGWVKIFFFYLCSLMTNMYTVSWLFTITKNASSSIFFHVSLFISISTVSSYIHSIRYRLLTLNNFFGSVQVCFIL